MLGNALVDTFVAAANEDDSRLLCQAASGFLIETFAGGGEKDDGGFLWKRDFLNGIAYGLAEQGFDCVKKRFGFENHTFAPAERAVVHGPVTVFCKFAQVLHMDLYNSRLLRSTQNAVVEGPGEKFRKNCNEIEAHDWRKQFIENGGAIVKEGRRPEAAPILYERTVFSASMGEVIYTSKPGFLSKPCLCTKNSVDMVSIGSRAWKCRLLRPYSQKILSSRTELVLPPAFALPSRLRRRFR